MPENESQVKPIITVEVEEEKNKEKPKKPLLEVKNLPKTETNASHHSRAMDQSADDREDMMRKAAGLPPEV